MSPTRQATSDANGHFELTNLPVGDATVRAERAGYLPAEESVPISAGLTLTTLAWPRGKSLCLAPIPSMCLPESDQCGGSSSRWGVV
jgi:carboxypeptidase family protein